jgi:Uncharacterised nucleotidyltransferase
VNDGLYALLGGQEVWWPALRTTAAEFLASCAEHDVQGLAHLRLGAVAHRDEWPPEIYRNLAAYAHRQAALEMLRGEEISLVLADLAAAGIRPVLIKGTPLAYGVYETPMCRPRADTDMLIREGEVAAARAVFARRGYTATVHCSDLFSQFEVQKEGRFGVVHVFDVHWKISTQPVFDKVLSYGEILPRAQAVPALGPHAMTAGPVDALLIACVHPVMHHRNAQRVLWIYDVHLLAGRLSAEEFDEFASLARRKQMAAICAEQLRVARTVFGTPVPPSVFDELSAPAEPEPSSDYLASQRRWHHELASSVRGLPRVGDRVRLLREVLLPSPGYMLAAYGLRGKPLAPWLLPALYLHRNVRGAWRILTGKK